ncbi:unnamed protein product [Ilex paraguariensis]|uniref:Uncharacterized protein n=1 Tax=Ilex paraguariensis TaxID=185542 RepID=A0ABC8SAV1_9AQUA
MNSYLASITVMVKLFAELSFDLVSDEVEFGAFLPVKNAGCFGGGKGMDSLLSIEITSDMVGLSATLSCTHKRPT